MRQEGFGAVDHAPEVDVHHPLDVLELAGLDVTAERDAGVVVDLVDLAEVLVDLVGVGEESFALGDVEAVDLDSHTQRGQPPLGLREPFGVDVADRQLRACAGQLDGQRLADA